MFSGNGSLLEGESAKDEGRTDGRNLRPVRDCPG